MKNNSFINEIPVVFAVNDNYLKYATITILSIIDHKKSSEQYFFYILHRNISSEHQSIVRNWLASHNISIEFINVKNSVNSQLFYVSGYITEETYYRILIPNLLPQWKTVIYMDCDIVCLKNLGSILEEVDFKNQTCWLAGTMASRNEMRKQYCEEHLGIPSDHFIFAGMLVMNCDALRRNEFEKKCYDYLTEKKWLRQHDMDLINAICYGHIKILAQCWHTTVGAISFSKSKAADKLTVDDLDCCMLHYATNKPWSSELTDVALPYWKYVFDSPFASEIVAEYKLISDTKWHFETMCEKNQVSLGFLFSMLLKSIRARGKSKNTKHGSVKKFVS